MNVPAPIRSHRTPTSLDRFLFGSPYYPEHWEPEIREKDPALFQAAGWNAIRMAEFAWSLMEPREGVFDFSLFDETIARFGAAGIRTILCTPTAAPPRWLTLNYPEVLRVDENGKTLTHGSRQHAGHFSPVFRAHSKRITEAMAAHFAENPHVIGWQTDNEIHCHFSEDHSPAAAAAFAGYLEERYGTIGNLNRAWGTVFWSQTYDTFGDIPTPRPAHPTYANPAHVLDYRRFLAQGAAVFQHDQVAILRRANPKWWITHNGVFRLVDYRGEFSRDLDFLGYDSYPFFDPDPANRRFTQAFNVDHARAFSGNLVILEQQSGPGGQGNYLHDNPGPGEMRRMAWTNVARGCDGILLFRERSCRFGAEEYWCGVIDHDNVPRRRYHEAAQLGTELARIGPELLGTWVEVKIGVATGDFDSQWGHEPITHGLPAPRQLAEIIHTQFNDAGYAVGCVHPGDPLGGIGVYLVPHFTLFRQEWVPGLEAWVRAGGTLVIGARTATKDPHGSVVAETPPGILRAMTGTRVEEYGRLNRPEAKPLSLGFKHAPADPVPGTLWYEWLVPEKGTEVLATWSGQHLSGCPAVTMRRLGAGCVIYAGTYFTAPVIAGLMAEFRSNGLLPPPENPVPGVEQVVRTDGKKRFRFFINHRESEATVPLVHPGDELIGQTGVKGSLVLGANGVAVVREHAA